MLVQTARIAAGSRGGLGQAFIILSVGTESAEAPLSLL